MTRTTVYTDGACSGNPGPGGWAWVVPDGPSASGGDAQTTNQRMELQAVLDAVETLDGPLEIVSDSTYVVNCFRDGWWEGWLRRGWVNSKRQPVANRDLWEPLVDRYQHRDLEFRWVKGHSGDRWNEAADQLAVEAARRHGAGQPTDDAAAAPTRDVDGHVILVSGHRPEALGGYDDNLFAASVRHRLQDILDAKATMHSDLTVLSGLGLGAETLAAEAAAAAGIEYVVVLPFPGSESRRPAAGQAHFRRLLADARQAHTLQRSAPETNQKVAASYRRRDAWMRRNADEAIVVWDGVDSTLAKSVKALNDELGEENVWVVDPADL